MAKMRRNVQRFDEISKMYRDVEHVDICQRWEYILEMGVCVRDSRICRNMGEDVGDGRIC
jgi:hypothetical protein